MTLLEAKKKEIYKALINNNGNKSKSARDLNISIRTLRSLTNNDPLFCKFRKESMKKLERLGPCFVLLMLVSAHAFGSTILPKGNAAWVYDVNSPNAPTAMWADWINFYNGNSLAPHNLPTIYSYGGDMGIINGVPTTSFPVKNQKAALAYKSVYGVKTVVATIDGQMNGGASYSPDLSKLSASQVQSWADKTAAMYCGFNFVDGVQIDLEPARAPYMTNLLVFLKQLSGDLSKGNCIDATHPAGRTIGVFMGAGAATPDVFTAIGSNGYVIVSGYDLSDTPAATVTEPVKYGQQLTGSLNAIVKSAAASKGSFMVGIPAAASVHEFSQYIPATGAPVFGYPMFSLNQPSYLGQALQAIEKTVSTNPGYLGTALWGFALQMANPVGSKSMYYPSIPFDQAGEINYLQKNL